LQQQKGVIFGPQNTDIITCDTGMKTDTSEYTSK